LFIGNLHRRYRVGSLWLFHEATLVVTNVDRFSADRTNGRACPTMLSTTVSVLSVEHNMYCG